MTERLRAPDSDLALDSPSIDIASNDEEPLHVLDLPQLHNKPTASDLLSVLEDLGFEPPSWDATSKTSSRASARRRKVDGKGVPSYLTKIISSSLAWIDDDEQKERIWEAASQRLSERSGRSAMGAMSRRFLIPLRPANDDATIELSLHEPALTGDSLGLKTWASSFLLAKRMCVLKPDLPQLSHHTRILELGSGTGLVGLATAAVLQTRVVLTDLPDIVTNLRSNARLNAEVLAANGGELDVAALDWSQPDHFSIQGEHDAEHQAFPLILVADPIYSSDHPRLLVQAIEHHLTRGDIARVVVELPLRDGYSVERDDFRFRMHELGLVVLSEGEESGFDDWSSTNDDELSEIRCWWSVWGWSDISQRVGDQK